MNPGTRYNFIFREKYMYGKENSIEKYDTNFG